MNGRTDISVLYRNVCIFVWEDKKLDESLTTVSEICQIAVEVKGFAKDFKRKIGFEAHRFCGVETSGIIWSFCNRYYRKGNNHVFYTVQTYIQTCALISINSAKKISHKFIIYFHRQIHVLFRIISIL